MAFFTFKKSAEAIKFLGKKFSTQYKLCVNWPLAKIDSVLSPKIDLKIAPVTIDDKDLCFKFLNTYFFPEEPLGVALGIKYKSVDDLGDWFEVLGHGLSFKAIDALDTSENNLLGLIINEVRIREERANYDEIPVQDGLKKIFKLMNHLESKSDLWNKLQVDRVFESVFLSVRPDCRGLNVGKKLMEKSLKFANALNYRYATAECSSFYSTKILADLGYDVYYDLKYENYRDENGEVIFPVKPPHNGILLCVKKLQN